MLFNTSLVNYVGINNVEIEGGNFKSNKVIPGMRYGEGNPITFNFQFYQSVISISSLVSIVVINCLKKKNKLVEDSTFVQILGLKMFNIV